MKQYAMEIENCHILSQSLLSISGAMVGTEL